LILFEYSKAESKNIKSFKVLESYNIASKHPKKHSLFVFRQSSQKNFPVDEFYRAVSAALPAWMVNLSHIQFCMNKEINCCFRSLLYEE